MRVVLISDKKFTDNKDTLHNNLLQGLKNRYSDLQVYSVEEEELKPCIGCFNCWIKTPGFCIFKDAAADITKDLFHSDSVIFITETKYGCYSPASKKVLDRIICLLMPFFKIVDGEMHHSPRYGKYPNLFVVGYGEDITLEEENTLKELVKANRVNFYSGNAKAYVCREAREIGKVLLDLHKDISGGKN